MEWWSKKIMGHSLLQEKWDLTSLGRIIAIPMIEFKNNMCITMDSMRRNKR